jgi:hypothetical protein
MGLRLGGSFIIIYSSFTLALLNAMLPILEYKGIKKTTHIESTPKDN